MPIALPAPPPKTEAPFLLVPAERPGPAPAPRDASGPSPHQIATEVSDIRREIIRLKHREAALMSGLPEPTRRPGWPMQRLPHPVARVPHPAPEPPQTTP